MSTTTVPSSTVSPPACPGGASDGTIDLPGRGPVAVRWYGQGQRTAGGGTPLVLHFHGGAFTSGCLDSGGLVARMLAGAGAVVVSLAYPLAPAHPFPEGMETGYATLEWLYKNRSKLAGRGARLYLAGEEAGGNIAAAVAVMARDQAFPPLAGQILLSPMLDPCTGTASLREATHDSGQCKWSEGWLAYLRRPRDAEHPYAVPGGSSRLSELAPTLVLAGADDPMRDEAQTYAERLRSAGVAVRWQEIPQASGWPDALAEGIAAECACALAVQQQFRQFFAGGPNPPC
ncbi:MAG: alpha/beta hydrolase [Pseudomonadota bacterium]